ncbi:F-box protein [Rhynchospora pubera]|uniref:F-box protein n=1 Tax=Rhynchospora pubera TaxID=906938 RepID=A0AAV8DJI9_9POAL|nr:F-box protein [Rhynchospora pubera]
MERMHEHPQARHSMDINQLPENCISHMFALTTPCDTCIASAVSSAFRSAADSDATWECFLLPDYRSFISTAVEPVEFSEGILLLEVCWLEIRAKIKCRVLSARTAYAAYLIFSMEDGANWLDTILQKSSIIMNGMTVSKHWMCIDPEGST